MATSEERFSDRLFKCQECGREFVFSAKEQEAYYKKGWKKPRYCNQCRTVMRKRRQQNADIEYQKRYGGIYSSIRRDGVEARQGKGREVNLHVGNSDKRFK